MWKQSILFLVLLVSNSCKKNKNKAVENAEFPNSIGTFWKYKVYNILNGSIDTVLITVVGNTNLDRGDPVTIWEIKSLFFQTTYSYVSNTSDGIKIYKNKLATALPYKKYVFPLEISKFWVTQNTLDTNKVVSQKDTIVLAKEYKNCYKIVRNTFIPYGQYIRETEFFLPKIGMVFRSYDEISSGPLESKIWELIGYSIK